MTTAKQGFANTVDFLLDLSVVGGFSNIGYKIRKNMYQWSFADQNVLTGKTVVVTGASSGIGRAAAHQLARMGANLWIVGRDADRLRLVQSELETLRTDISVRSEIVDFLSLNNVSAFADKVLAENQNIDCLLHNAGAMFREFELTEDGNERTAQVHVLAPFLLTTKLHGLLRQSGGARVITMSSGGMYTARLDVGRLSNLTDNQGYNGARAYALAKRAQVVLTELWATDSERRPVTFHSMHPGWVKTAGLSEALPGFIKILGKYARSAEQGADTMTWLTWTPDAVKPQFNGKFWCDRKPRLTHRVPFQNESREERIELVKWCQAHTQAHVEQDNR